MSKYDMDGNLMPEPGTPYTEPFRENFSYVKDYEGTELKTRLEALEKRLDSFISAFSTYASENYEWGRGISSVINNERDALTNLARGLNKLSDYVVKGNGPSI